MWNFLRFGFLVLVALPALASESWVCPDTGKRFMTGAVPSSSEELAQAALFVPPGSPPKHVAYVPRVRSMFGNDRYGVCVTSEEAFAKSCWIAGVQPEIDVPEPTVVDWARRRGLLHGASLGPVCDMMVQEGFRVGSQLYNNGSKRLVDFRDGAALRAAIATGPVKVAIPAAQLGRGAGSRDGWYALGGSSRGSDHCVSLCGYGDAEWLYGELGVDLPPALKPDTEGFLCYTWATIGFVDEAWVSGNVREAWVRTPTTVGVPPISPPYPGPGPLVRLWRHVVVAVVGLVAGVIVGYFLLARGPFSLSALLAWFSSLGD